MANINIAEWTPEQVVQWMAGLDNRLTPYLAVFKDKGVNGARLLSLQRDDLDSLGMPVIGHQELLLEAVEHLRNFQYEIQRENIQMLAMRLSVAATSLYRELRSHHDGRQLETQTLSDVARMIATVKPLVCWLDRSPFITTEKGPLLEHKSALLKLSLEAATCAQRDRFAEHPTRAIVAAAATLAGIADYIVQDVLDPKVLQPASVISASWSQGTKPLGISVLPSFCGHHQVTDIRFGCPAHAAHLLQEGDEIIQVGDQPVIGWAGAAVCALCVKVSNDRGLLPVAVRRRACVLHTHRHNRRPWEHNELGDFKRELGLLRCSTHRPVQFPISRFVDDVTHSSSDESEALSPPASPTQMVPDTRLYPPPPRIQIMRRHSISGGSPVASRHDVAIQQFWQELRNQKCYEHSGSSQINNNNDFSNNFYRRDKSVSYSTGLEISPRPKTCLGVGVNRNKKDKTEDEEGLSPTKTRGKLDKSHSTPAYDYSNQNNDEPGSLVTQIIPESPSTPTDSPTILVHSAEKADQILDFKKYSSQIGEAILQQQNKNKLDDKPKFTYDGKELDDAEKILETINIAMVERQNKNDKVVTTKQATYKLQTTFGENGHTSTTKTFTTNEHVKTIQNEVVQAINENRVPKPAPDLPPEPPPRPLFTQKPFMKDYPPLKSVKQVEVEQKDYPLKPIRHIESVHISLPIKHITKHDIQMVPMDKRDLPPVNCDNTLNLSQVDISKSSSKTNLNIMSNPDLVSSMSLSMSESHSLQKLDSSLTLSPIAKAATLSPPSSVVRNIFPSKSKSLKKKNSLLIKRRRVSAESVNGVVWRGYVLQRVRSRTGTGVWARRLLLLTENALLAYRHLHSTKADCLIFLNGFTVAAATEVKSKPFAFKVYHTGTAVYFAADSVEDLNMWIQQISRATLHTIDANYNKIDEIKNFSETDYSDENSDKEEKREHLKEKEKEKDKSKFGSLKKLTHRMHRSESQENVNHSSTSLDRKYLRFFSRNKNKEDNKKEDSKHKEEKKQEDSKSKSKQPAAPVPTEHYRSYRRVNPPQYTQTEQTRTPHNIAKIKKIDPIQIPSPEEYAKNQKKIPKPINYIHASNPNLLDFEKNDFITRPTMYHIPLPKPKVRKHDNFVGFITLEEFMLKEQEQERRQVYSNRVLMGIEKDKKEDRSNSKKAAKELQKQWERIIPDVIYGELPTYSEDQLPIPVLEQIQSRSLPKTPEKQRKLDKNIEGKPISVKGKDGYEKIVYTVDKKDEPPKILPRRPRTDKSPDIERKSSMTAKDLGYEVIYDEKDKGKLNPESAFVEKPRARRSSEDIPPKIMPKSKHVLNRQNSLNRNSGVDMSPVFVQGESPEKFWLNSLRRHDKQKEVANRVKALKSVTQYTPMVLPLAGTAGLATAPHLEISLDSKDCSPVNRTVYGDSSGGGRGKTAPILQDARPQEEVDDWCLRLPSPEVSQYPHLKCPPTFQPETYSLTDKSFVKNPEDK